MLVFSKKNLVNNFLAIQDGAIILTTLCLSRQGESIHV